MLVDANKVKSFITEPNLEVELRPLLLFRGQVTAGQAKARFNFLRTAMEAELPTVPEITKASAGGNDVAHLCGLHAKTGWQRLSIFGFFSRILQSPSVLERTKGLRDYIHWVVKQTPRGRIYHLDRISETSVWSKRAWRRVSRARKPRTPLAEYYPYITTAPTSDHELLLAVESIIPKTLPHEVRADVCQDMIVSILTGEITLDNLRDRRGEYIKSIFKQMPSRYGHLSLDAPMIFGDGKSRTLGETIV